MRELFVRFVRERVCICTVNNKAKHILNNRHPLFLSKNCQFSADQQTIPVSPNPTMDQEQKGITPSEQKELRRVFDHLSNFSKKRKLYVKLNPLVDRRQKLIQAKKSSFEIQVQDADGGLMSEAQIDEETEKLTVQIEILQKSIGEFDT